MGDDLSLLLKIRGDSSQAVKAAADTRAAIAQLRQSLLSDVSAMQTAGQSALKGIGDNLNLFIGQRIPLVGGAFVRITENLRGLGGETSKAAADIASFSKTVDNLAASTGKSSSQITSFLQTFVQLESQAKRDTFAIEQFGAAAASSLIPQLEAAGEEMSALAVAAPEVATGFSAVLAAMGPVGIAAAGIAVEVAALAVGFGVLVAAGEEVITTFFGLAKSAAGFRGELLDLSQQTGVSVETLSALEVVAATTGGNLQSIAQSLVIFQGKLEEAQDPASKTAAKFAELGVSINDTETALRDALKAINALPEGFEKTNSAAELFGRRGGKQFLAILKETHGNLDETIKRLRALGIEVTTADALIADEFEDRLKELNFQFRALVGKEAIPAVTDAIKALSKFLQENKIVVEAVGVAVHTFGLALEGVVLNVIRLPDALAKSTAAVVHAIPELETLALLYERIATASGLIKPIQPTDVSKAAIAAGVTSVATSAAQSVQPDAAALQQQVNILKVANDEISRISKQRIAEAEDAFNRGKVTREKETADIIAANKEQLDADKAQLNAELAVQNARLARDADNVEAQIKSAQLRQQIKEKESAFDVNTQKLQTALQAEERKDLIAHEKAKLDILLGAGEARIQLIESQVKAGVKAAADGEKEIEAIEAAGFKARKFVLEQELAAAKPDERQGINDKLTALEQERTANLQKQTERRTEIERQANETDIAILVANAEAILRLQTSTDEQRIASLKVLAAARVKTEEDAAKAITQILLDANQRQQDVIEVKRTAAGALPDADERKRVENDLNNQLRQLEAERTAIERDGERDQEEGRQKDLDNERKYANDLFTTRRRTVNIERQAEQEVINLMILQHAKRKDIIRAQAQFDLADEADRHAREQNSIEAQRRENEESNRTQAEKDAKTAELNRLEEAEAERHRLAMQGIEAEAKVKVGQDNASPVSAFDQLATAANENLTGGKLTAAIAGISAMQEAFRGLGEAVGQVVEAFILYGDAGTSVQKVTAQIIASVAKQAAIKAVFELAEGFAALALSFLGLPNAGPSAAAHFQAAAIYGSIAGVAAVAGRAIAGNAFNQPQGAGGGGGNNTSAQPLQTIVQGRNQSSDRRITIHLTSDLGELKKVIVGHVVNDYNDGGDIREVIANDGR
jgi:hypothetical protein